MVPKQEKKVIPIDEHALDNYLSQFDKEFGTGSAFILNDSRISKDIEVIPSGIFPLDAALGVGGLPRGRIIEIYGMESSGKTSLALQFVASVEKKGGKAHFIDAEHALDLSYAKKIGLNPDVTVISQPENGEQALEMAIHAVSSGIIDLVVIDSVAALVPKSELEGSMGDPQMGVQARLMSQAMRKVVGKASETNTTVIFINQMRMKIGVVFGNPETTPGGNALKFYSSVRLDVRSAGKLKKGEEEPYGQRVKVKVVKNKVAPPFREAEFDLIFGEGFDTMRSLIEAAVEVDIVEKSGAWYSFKGERLGQGMENSIENLAKNPEWLKEIQKLLESK